MRKKQSDFIVGITIFIALILLVAGVIWLKEVSLTRKNVQYTMLFPNIGGLQKGDPVTVNGVKRGTVSSIYLYNSQVAVAVKLDDAVPFTDSSSVMVQNVGLMGERKIEIALSPKGEKYTPDLENDTTFIVGSFDTGIAEAIGMLGNIMQDAGGLLDTVEMILGATVGDPKFLEFFDNAVERLDTISIVVDRLLTKNEQKLNILVTDLKKSGNTVRTILTDNQAHFNTISENTEVLTQNAINLTTELDSIMMQAESIAAKIDTGNGTVGQLLNSEELAVQLENTLEQLDTLLAITEEDGLKLRVKLGFKTKKKDEKELEEFQKQEKGE